MPYVRNKDIFLFGAPNSCSIEYNTDTSAGHPVKDDDIVRHSFEKRRVKDKEP